MTYINVQTIVEIIADHSTSHVVSRVNAHLNMGWAILDIHQRGFDYTNVGENARYSTVYILGHSDRDAVRPVPADSRT